MPKDISMQHTAHHLHAPSVPPVTPWSLRAWPPLLWQAGRASGLRFHHLGTRVTHPCDALGVVAGQTMWGGSSAQGEAGVAWDWIEIGRGVVAMADPLSVITNLRLIGEEGEVLTAMESALYLNELVHALPWQTEVARAIATPVGLAQ
jgi:hypothetical protein